MVPHGVVEAVDSDLETVESCSELVGGKDGWVSRGGDTCGGAVDGEDGCAGVGLGHPPVTLQDYHLGAGGGGG